MEPENFKILLIDDDEDAFARTRELLSRSEEGVFEVDWVADYAGGFEKYRNGNYDACLLDYRLGEGADGLAFLREARAVGSLVPIIFLTGCGNRELNQAAMKEGAADYLIKDVMSAAWLERSILNAIARKKSDRLSWRKDELNRRIVESVPGGIVLVSKEGAILQANAEARRFLGLRHDEMGKIHVADYENKTLREDGSVCEVAEYPVSRCLATGEAQPKMMIGVQHPDGTTGWAIFTATPLLDDGTGEQKGAVVTFLDITERRQAEEKLRESEQRLRSIIEAAPECIKVLAKDGSLVEMNPAGLGMIEVDSIEVVRGKNVCPLVAPADREAFMESVAEVFRGKTISLDFGIVGMKGTHRWLQMRAVPITDRRGAVSGMLGVTRDMTEQMNLEAQLRHSQKMESVGQMAAGIAHDFNNILNIILGYATLLTTDGNFTGADQHALNQISTAAERAANLTRQLLTFSRKQVIQARPIDLNQVITNMTNMLHRALGEHIALEFVQTAGLPLVNADVGMMEQVVINLSVNARDAMPGGGRLTISTSPVTVGAENAQRNPESRPGQYACLEVTDTGCGIPQNVLPLIFDPFFTTKDVGKGTGLGLATVYGIVKQHHGWIEVESEMNRGAVFRVYFPACDPDRLKGAAQKPMAPIRGGTETILLVEDEAGLRELTEGVLRQYGYRVLSATSGVDALRVWELHAGAVDLLVTDMVMPEGVSGRDLADQLRAKKPGLKVIFTSGYSVDILRKDFALQEVGQFLQKPFRHEMLAQMIRESLDR